MGKERIRSQTMYSSAFLFLSCLVVKELMQIRVERDVTEMSEYRLRSSNRFYFFPKGNTFFFYFNLTSSNFLGSLGVLVRGSWEPSQSFVDVVQK
jgi:hypothetical protein